MNKLVFLILLHFSNILIAQNNIEFVNEKIDFTINSTTFTVNGIYDFANCSSDEIHQTILFPFSSQADSLIVKRVYNLTYNKNLQYQKVDNGIVFKMSVLPMDTVNVNIAYSQKSSKENIYILESTLTWGKPLQKANYSLTVDSSVVIDCINLKPDTLINNVYHWSKTNFYPSENFNVWVK